jgi:hypothetical protein
MDSEDPEIIIPEVSVSRLIRTTVSAMKIMG